MSKIIDWLKNLFLRKKETLVPGEIDLLKTNFSGKLLVKIQGLGNLEEEVIIKSSDENSLAWFVYTALAMITHEVVILNHDENFPWEVVSFSREKRELVVKQKS